MNGEGSDHVIDMDRLPGGENAVRFDGQEHGASASFFITNNRPGPVPGLHRHPYEETFILESEPMKTQVLFVHGGGRGAYEEDKKLAANLRDVLGAAYDVRCPKMPDEDSPEYGAWKDRIAEELVALDGEAILVGHSLGASILLKYLSEEKMEKTVAGVFLVAPPYWGCEDWEVSQYALHENFASKLPEDLPVFFYHSRDDEWAPFAHLARYTEKLPRATIREFDGRGHQFNDDLSEVARDIERL